MRVTAEQVMACYCRHMQHMLIDMFGSDHDAMQKHADAHFMVNREVKSKQEEELVDA